MKITQITTTLLQIPHVTRRQPGFSIGPGDLFPNPLATPPAKSHAPGPNLLILQIETEGGIAGIANTNYAVEPVRTFIDRNLGPVIQGGDPFQTQLHWERMYRTHVGTAREGVGRIPMGLIDIALWDIKGKFLGQPVYNLLGGKTRDRLRVYASRLYAPDTGFLREEAARPRSPERT